jgi:predicted RNA-binding protein with PUA-like domain
MAYWLFKSEPDVFGWDDLVAKGDVGEEWDGVRNYQARNNMRAMAVGDLGFFYHSRSGLEVVGIVEVCAAAHQDSTTEDERWDCVDVRAIRPFTKPVPLQTIKADPRFAEMALVKSTRLSVQPVTDEEWTMVCEMGETDPNN